MSTATKQTQLTFQNTAFKGVVIKRLPLKAYFKALELWQQIKTIDQRLISLTDYYNKGKLSREKYIQTFKDVSKHTLELYKEFFSLSLKCNHNFITNIINVFKVNRDKILKAHIKNRPIVKQTELSKLSILSRIKVHRKATTINDTYDNLTYEILIFNYPDLFKSNPDTPQPETKNLNQYLEIVTALSTRLSKADIDNLYIDEAIYLIKSFKRETVREFFETHFAGIRYQILSQSSFKNDESGTKRNAEMQKVIDGFLDVILSRDQEPKKSAFILEMEKEALSVLKAKESK